MSLKITLLFAICTLTQQVYAQEQKLHIIQQSGNHVSIPIANQPKIVFENGVMYVGSESFLVSNVVKYIIGSDEALAVKDTVKDGLHIDANDAANGKVLIENYNGQTIKVYGTNGVEMPCKVTVSGTSAMVDYSTLPTGIYVLYVGKENIKIQKR